VKNKVLIGNSVPNNLEIYATILGKRVIIRSTAPIINHKNEYSSFSFLLRTNSIIPVKIMIPRIITTMFNLVEIFCLLNIYLSFFLKSIIKMDNSIFTM
jgi:hypothetical protein